MTRTFCFSKELAWITSNHSVNRFFTKSSKATATNATNHSNKIIRKNIQFKSQWFWSSRGHHIPCKAIPVNYWQILDRLGEHWARFGSKHWFGSWCKMWEWFIPQSNDHVTLHTFPTQHHWKFSSLQVICVVHICPPVSGFFSSKLHHVVASASFWI